MGLSVVHLPFFPSEQCWPAFNTPDLALYGRPCTVAVQRKPVRQRQLLRRFQYSPARASISGKAVPPISASNPYYSRAGNRRLNLIIYAAVR